MPLLWLGVGFDGLLHAGPQSDGRFAGSNISSRLGKHNTTFSVHIPTSSVKVNGNAHVV